MSKQQVFMGLLWELFVGYCWVIWVGNCIEVVGMIVMQDGVVVGVGDLYVQIRFVL